MLISEVSSLTSWAGNVRTIVLRETFKYDKGNDVMVVTYQNQKFELYSDKGKEIPSQSDRGSTVDVNV